MAKSPPSSDGRSQAEIREDISRSNATPKLDFGPIRHGRWRWVVGSEGGVSGRFGCGAGPAGSGSPDSPQAVVAARVDHHVVCLRHMVFDTPGARRLGFVKVVGRDVIGRRQVAACTKGVASIVHSSAVRRGVGSYGDSRWLARYWPRGRYGWRRAGPHRRTVSQGNPLRHRSGPGSGRRGRREP